MTEYNGLHNKDDMVGKVYGLWTVLAFSHKYPSSGNWYYLCVCSCGITKKVSASRLRCGHSTMCQSCSGRINGRKGLYNRAGQDDLYFIRCGNFIKIGVTNNVPRRLRDLQSSNPYPLELVYEGKGEGCEEESWHTVFQHRHHQGEWFNFPVGASCEI